VLNYNASASAIQTALNLNATVAAEGSVDVIDLSSVMRQVRYRTTGVKTPMTIDSTLLFPTSYGKVIPLRAGSSTVRAINFIKVAQSPVIYQTQWDSIESIEPVLATITTIGVGHKRIELKPAPSIGSWTLTTTPNVWRSWRLQPNWGTVSQALPATFWSASTTLVVPAVASDANFQFVATNTDVTGLKMYPSSDYFQPNVQLVGDGIYDVIWDYDPIWMPPDATYNSLVNSFRNAPSGYTYPLSVNPAGLKPRKGFTATINLNSAEIEYLLAGAATVSASLEIEVSTSGTKQTILMSECSIKNDMIDGYAYNPIELDVAVIPDAPSNNLFYGRKDGGWTPLTEIDGGSY
jgi:hypothetical protein